MTFNTIHDPVHTYIHFPVPLLWPPPHLLAVYLVSSPLYLTYPCLSTSSPLYLTMPVYLSFLTISNLFILSILCYSSLPNLCTSPSLYFLCIAHRVCLFFLAFSTWSTLLSLLPVYLFIPVYLPFFPCILHFRYLSTPFFLIFYTSSPLIFTKLLNSPDCDWKQIGPFV